MTPGQKAMGDGTGYHKPFESHLNFQNQPLLLNWENVHYPPIGKSFKTL